MTVISSKELPSPAKDAPSSNAASEDQTMKKRLRDGRNKKATELYNVHVLSCLSEYRLRTFSDAARSVDCVMYFCKK